MICTWLGLTNTPCFGLQSKYLSPCTEPSFLPTPDDLHISSSPTHDSVSLQFHPHPVSRCELWVCARPSYIAYTGWDLNFCPNGNFRGRHCPLLIPCYILFLMLAAVDHCLNDYWSNISNGRHKVKARTRRETRGHSGIDDTSWIDKEWPFCAYSSHSLDASTDTYIHYITMPDLSQAVPSKDLKQWHSPSSRSEAIDTLIHGVGTRYLMEVKDES